MVVNYISIDNEKICIPYFLWGANNSLNKCVAFIESESESLSHIAWLFANPMNYTVHGILQPRILEWKVFPLLQGIFPNRDWTQASHIAGGFLTSWVTREVQEYWSG